MKVTLSFEKTITKDISIMVDALRASTTITVALNTFDKIIPCFTEEEAFKIKKTHGGVLGGERNGIQIKGFDVGNSPEKVENFKLIEDNQRTLILTTSNGTRILKDMESTVLIGSFVNSKAAAKKAIELCENEIDVVMAGLKGNFALEDFLASGEILYWIKKELDNNNVSYEMNDLARAAILGSRNNEEVKEAIYNCNAGKKLEKLNYKEDIDYSIQTNITNNVAIYKKGILKLIN